MNDIERIGLSNLLNFYNIRDNEYKIVLLNMNCCRILYNGYFYDLCNNCDYRRYYVRNIRDDEFEFRFAHTYVRFGGHQFIHGFCSVNDETKFIWCCRGCKSLELL